MKKDLDNKIIQAGMFNDKASDNERQKRLEDLIRKDYMEDEEEQETEIPNDDQINEIISRSPEEYEIFTKMDQERYILENKEARMREIQMFYYDEHQKKGLPLPNVQNINYRLIQEFEVPEWIKKHSKPEDPDNFIQEYGARKRRRKEVNYNEELSEGQWLKIIEQGGDPQEEAEKIRSRRKEMEDGLANDGIPDKRRKLDGGFDDEDEYDDEDDEDEEEDYQYSSKHKSIKNNHNSTKISIPNFGNKYDDQDMEDGLV